MRSTHVIENLTLRFALGRGKYELELTSPAEVNVRYEWQPADGPLQPTPQVLVFDVITTDVMLFDSEGVSWSFAAGQDITHILSKTDLERIEEALQETRQLEAA